MELSHSRELNNLRIFDGIFSGSLQNTTKQKLQTGGDTQQNSKPMSTPTKADTPRLPEEASTGKGAGAETAKAAAPVQPTQQAAKGGSVSDLDRQIEALRRCEYLKESEVKAICAKAREILVDESNVQRVDAPVTVSNLYLSFGSPV